MTDIPRRVLDGAIQSLLVRAEGDGAGEVHNKAELEGRARALGKRVRCLTCANQSVEDSNSEFAIRLRKEIRERLGKGLDEEQVSAALQREYGDRVLYTPPLDALTAMLWGSPILLTAALFGAVVRAKSRRASLKW